MLQHNQEKARMIEEEKKQHFSYDVLITLTEEEKSADEKLKKLRDIWASPLYNVVLQDFHDMKAIIEASQFYDVLDKMPKGGLHHIHTTAAPHVEEYIKLTYDPVVAYNEREGMFKVLLGHEELDGYVKCVEIRNFYKDPNEYDEILRSQILLTPKESRGLESHEIWKGF